MKFHFRDKKFIFLLIAVFIVVSLEVLSILNINIPMPFAPFVFGAFVLIIGYEVLWEGLKALLRLKFSSINLLMLIAVVAAFYLGEYPEAAVVVVLYVLGEKLEDLGIEQSKSALDSLVSNSPKTAVLKLSGESIPIENIEVGSVVVVKPHDLIPLDGVIEHGETSIDESTITGEPISKNKTIGDVVFAGTLNQSGYIEFKTTKKASDSTLAKIIELTFVAQAEKSNSQKFVQKFAKIYTPCIIFLALGLFLFPTFVLGLDANHWLNQAITLLVISCPCAFVISTPVAIYAAIGNASSRGALFKGGKYLETIAQIKAICLDKTRTLTYGKPVVSDIFLFNNTTQEELLSCVAGVENLSEHPLAHAILEKVKKENLPIHEVANFKSIAGKGAMASCLDCPERKILVGNLKFIEEQVLATPEVKEAVQKLSTEGKTAIIAAFNMSIVGVIGLADEIKPESQQVISEIRQMNVEPIMLTGDSQQSANYVAQQLDITKVYGDLLPHNKVEQVKEALITYGAIGMVGDGVNDAPALAQSTVGIAMGATGSDTAIEIANIALMNDNLLLIPFLIRLGRKTVQTIKRNVTGAILIKIVFIVLAFLGYGNLVMAITADVGVTLVVILISLRLMNFEKVKLHKKAL